jgi:hypothetical protein
VVLGLWAGLGGPVEGSGCAAASARARGRAVWGDSGSSAQDVGALSNSRVCPGPSSLAQLRRVGTELVGRWLWNGFGRGSSVEAKGAAGGRGTRRRRAERRYAAKRRAWEVTMPDGRRIPVRFVGVWSTIGYGGLRCLLMLIRAARWLTVGVLGVLGSWRLVGVRTWQCGGSGLTVYRSLNLRRQSGQSLIEYGLILGMGGVLCWGLLSMSGLTVTDLLRLVVGFLFPGSVWLLGVGSF